MGDASSPPPPERANSAPTTIIPVRILTHNIRFATDTPDQSELLWNDRFPHLSSHFKFLTRPHFAPPSTLVCMQEVLHGQLLDLHRRTFNTSTSSDSQPDGDENDWSYVGVGRNDGKTKGEYSPIFFRKSAWRCLYSDTIWLNETGAVGKKGWDASSIRIMTCAVLESVVSGPSGADTARTILALNTHLDDQGEVSRRESAKLILQISSRLRARYSPQFAFLAGDLNSQPRQDAYQILNAAGSGFVDTRRLIPDDTNRDGRIYAFGNERTFTGFPKDPAAAGRQRIDFVHLGVREGCAEHDEQGAEFEKVADLVQAYGVLPSRFDDGVWMSDHRGVVVDLLVPFHGR